jgi:TonB-dependent starch-binding outer membrane protein SusC
MMKNQLLFHLFKKRHNRLLQGCFCGFLMGLFSMPTFAQTARGDLFAENTARVSQVALTQSEKTATPPPSVFSSKMTKNRLNAIENADILVSGIVRDELGEPLVGASIVVKGTTLGTVTDVEGAFKLAVANGQAVLVVSFIGYNNKEITVGKQTTLNITLESDAKNLGEVVVIGYGATTNKLTTTGAIARVTSDEFKTTTVNSVDQILQGRTAGVNVISTSGEPGADIIVNIRGVNSISGNNQPLYVIDGFPVAPTTDAPIATTGGNNPNGLFGLNPNDIESIDVLKDAAATAIYGSRAANGVVMITTKKGKVGESMIEITNKTGVGIISSPYQMMNSMQYVDIKNEQSIRNNQVPVFNVEDFANRTSTNWLKELTRNSTRQETGVSFRGGSGNTNYFISGSYLNEKGVVINSGNERSNLRFNVNTTIKKWYSIRAQMAATKQNQAVGITQARGWPGAGGPILNALRGAPVFENNLDFLDVQPDAIDGVTLGSAANPFLNPVLEQTIKKDNRLSDQVIANIENIFYLDPKHKYELHVVTGTSLSNVERQLLFPPVIDRTNGGTAQQGKSKTVSYNGSAFLIQRYEKGKMKLNNTLGVEITKNISESFSATAQGLDYPSIALQNLGSGKTQKVTSGKTASLIESAFYRFSLNRSNRYVLSGSLRLDGSSRFAENNKLGLFPSAGFTWNMSEEPFIKSKIKSLDLAKVRISYGTTGNDRSLPVNRSVRLYTTGFYDIGLGGGTTPFVPVSVAQPNNPNLVWESTSQFNVGTDLTFKGNKWGISFEYYDKTTKDLLQNVPYPAQSGFTNIWANVGTIRNRGVELSINTNQIKTKNFSWSTNVNISKNKTILVDLGNFDPFSAQNLSGLGGNLLSGNSHALIPGKELGIFYGYKVDGLYQPSDFNANGTPKDGVAIFQSNAPDTRVGRLRYVNSNGSANNIVNDSDRVVIGNAAPDFTFGFTNNFRYKKFNLNVLFTGSYGNDIQNVTNAYIRSGNLGFLGVSFNQTEEWYKNRWTLDNPHNDARFPATASTTGIVTADANSSMIEDGSYIRLKNITLGYTFNVKGNKFMKSINAYVTATDLLIFTNYTGFDPEASTYGTDPRLQGIDYGAYPRNRNVTFGLTIGL